MVQYKPQKLSMEVNVRLHNTEQNSEVAALHRKLNSALRYALITCAGGASNKAFDLKKTNGWSATLEDRYDRYNVYEKNGFIQKGQFKWFFTEDSTKDMHENLLISLQRNHPLSEETLTLCGLNQSHYNLLELALVGIEQRAGNCGVLSCLVAKYLWENNEGIFRIEFLSANTYDHTWVVVNREFNSDIDDSNTWGLGCYCVDAWYEKHGIILNASEFYEYMRNIEIFALEQEQMLKDGLKFDVYRDSEGRIAYNEIINFKDKPALDEENSTEVKSPGWKSYCEINLSIHKYPYTTCDVEKQYPVESYYFLYKSYYPLQALNPDSNKETLVNYLEELGVAHTHAFTKCLLQIENINTRLKVTEAQIAIYKEICQNDTTSIYAVDRMKRVLQFEKDFMAIQTNIKPISPQTANRDWSLEFATLDNLNLTFYHDMLHYDAKLQVIRLEAVEKKLQTLYANKAKSEWMSIEIIGLEQNTCFLKDSLPIFFELIKLSVELKKVKFSGPEDEIQSLSDLKIAEKIALYEAVSDKLSSTMELLDNLHIEKQNLMNTMVSKTGRQRQLKNCITLEFANLYLQGKVNKEYNNMQKLQFNLRKHKAQNILNITVQSAITTLNEYWEARLFHYPTKYQKVNPAKSKRGLFIRDLKKKLEEYSQTGKKSPLIKFIKVNSQHIYDAQLLSILKKLVVTVIYFEARHLTNEEDTKNVLKLNLEKSKPFLVDEQVDFDELVYKATEYGYLDVLIDLFENKVDLNKQMPEADIPLHVAVFYRQAHIVAFFAEKKIDLNQMYMKASLAYLAVQLEDVEMLEVLALYGAPLNHLSENGLTPLLAALDNGYVNELKMLINQGVETTQIMSDDRNPIFYAAKENHVNMVQFLLQMGMQWDMSCVTPAETLIEYAKTVGDKVLFNMTAFIEKQRLSGVSDENISMIAQDIAEILGHDEIVELLNEHALLAKANTVSQCTKTQDKNEVTDITLPQENHCKKQGYSNINTQKQNTFFTHQQEPEESFSPIVEKDIIFEF